MTTDEQKKGGNNGKAFSQTLDKAMVNALTAHVT